MVTSEIVLSLPSGELRLGARPLLMGILNANPDSFSDAGELGSLEERIVRARDLEQAGADMIDIGGESASPARPRLTAEEEIARVVPLIEAVRSQTGCVVSVDTYKPAVAAAAVAAGAQIINDISGLADPEVGRVAAAAGAGLVVMHNRARPKQRLLDPLLYDDVVVDVEAFLAEALVRAQKLGVGLAQLILDPGPDFAKTPVQTVAVLRGLERIRALDRPILLPISRKDFIGALTRRPPRERLAGTLAAVDYGLSAGAHIFRVHDVAAVARFIDERAA